MVRDIQRWIAGGAVMVGAGRSFRGLVNQDAFFTWPQRLPAERVIGAVSDGHSGLSHFRSDLGAQFAVAAAGKAICNVTKGGERLRETIMGHWRAAVTDHAAAHPLNRAERLIADARIETPYRATLLAAGIGRGTLHLLQIGDGSIRLGHSDGRITRPMPVAKAGHGAQPHSLGLREAEHHLEHVCRPAVEGASEVDFVMLATDGVTGNFADNDAVDAVARRLRRFALSHPAAIVEGLGDCLDRMAEWGNGDDSGLWLAVRHSASPT
jgi:serine/threonine protein phosphatase PrpC